MDEKDVSNSYTDISNEKNDCLHPMFLGVCCAFVALKLSPESDMRNKMLKCSAVLLGWFVWRAQREGLELLQKLENTKNEIQDLKKIRSEDAKANEKVVSIVSAREQRWMNEKKKLRLQIGALMNDLRVLVSHKNKYVSDLNERLKEKDVLLRLRDEAIEEKEKRRTEIEGKLEKALNLVDELKESVYFEAQSHSREILKHKTAFMELVSSKRRLESEMGRALKQVETVNHELDLALEQKDQSILMAQRLSMELGKVTKDSQQKEHVLSAVFAENQMLLDELKSLKIKQGVPETPRSKVFSDSSIEETKITSDIQQLENSVNSEAKNHKFAVEQRHQLVVEALMDQLIIKDQKLEATGQRLLSTEHELKRLLTYIEGLNYEITQLKQDNIKLEGILLVREAELHKLEDHIALQSNPSKPKKLRLNCSPHKVAIARDTVWSKVEVVKGEQGQKMQEMNAIADEISQEVDSIDTNDIVITFKPGSYCLRQETIKSKGVANSETSTCMSQESSKKSNRKIDILALGISCKIKRLKQQLLMLERLTGKQESCESADINAHFGIKAFCALMPVLNKQVNRYQSLQGKTEDLCKRMHDQNNPNSNCGGSTTAKTEEETKRLELFLGETFHLQRYIVATGQKLMEVQAKIGAGFLGEGEDIVKLVKFDPNRFADSIRTLFSEVQRDLEVRISRMIGNLEGTLAFNGIIHLKK